MFCVLLRGRDDDRIVVLVVLFPCLGTRIISFVLCLCSVFVLLCFFQFGIHKGERGGSEGKKQENICKKAGPYILQII